MIFHQKVLKMIIFSGFGGSPGPPFLLGKPIANPGPRGQKDGFLIKNHQKCAFFFYLFSYEIRSFFLCADEIRCKLHIIYIYIRIGVPRDPFIQAYRGPQKPFKGWPGPIGPPSYLAFLLTNPLVTIGLYTTQNKRKHS